MSSKLTITAKVKSNNFKYISGAVVQDVANALYLEAEKIMTDSKMNYVPVISGALRNSGTVLKPVITNNSVVVTLGYGGSAVDYASKVHEAPISIGQHKNKYLQKPINSAVAGMASRLTLAVKASVNRRGKST